MIYGKHCWDNSLLEFLRMQSCLVITRSNNSRIRTAASRVKHGPDFVLTKVAKSRELCGVCCILQKSDRVITSSHYLPRDACHIWNKKQRFCHWSLFLLWIRQPQRNSKLRSPFPHIWYRKAVLHTVTSEWTRWRLKLQASRLITQPFVQAQIKKTLKLRVTGLCEGNTPVTGNSPHKGPATRKMFPFDDADKVGMYCDIL